MRPLFYGAGGSERILAQNVDANDIVVTAKSTLYFADAEHRKVGYIDATGKSRIYMKPVTLLGHSAWLSRLIKPC